MGYTPWGHRELDTTERVTHTHYIEHECCSLVLGIPYFTNEESVSLGCKCSGVHSRELWNTHKSYGPLEESQECWPDCRGEGDQ